MIDEVFIGTEEVFDKLIKLIYSLIILMDNLKLDDISTFLKIYEIGTFTQASKLLGLTQSALSQKVARLEDRLQAAVFVRHPRKLELTASGQKLLIYGKELMSMHKDFIENFETDTDQVSGVIRIAGFSSVMRSVVIPRLAGLIRSYPQVSIEFSSYEVNELENILKTNKADMIVTDFHPSITNLQTKKIFTEEYVVIESKKHRDIPHTFLDHGPYDNATESYFNFIGNKKKYNRAFMDDVYSIVDGVALGLGKAVMSKHIVEDDKRFKITKSRKRYLRDVVLSHYSQNYYSKLHQLVVKELSS